MEARPRDMKRPCFLTVFIAACWPALAMAQSPTNMPPSTLYETGIVTQSMRPTRALSSMSWMDFVPGLPQFRSGEPLKGSVLAGAFTASSAFSIGLFADSYGLKEKSNRIVKDAEQSTDYLSRVHMMSDARDAWDQALREEGWAAGLLCAAAAFWAYGIFDHFTGAGSDFRMSHDRSGHGGDGCAGGSRVTVSPAAGFSEQGASFGLRIRM
jgi:hypothetical protein